MKPIIELPVAHGEGKFMVRSGADMRELESDGQIVLRYVSRNGGEPAYPEDPNGSMGHVAGVCNKRGTIFGLMPHPERFLHRTNHPRWTREPIAMGHSIDVPLSDSFHSDFLRCFTGDGVAFFKNAFEYCSRM